MAQHRHAFCLTGYVEINDVKAEHPVRKLCPNNHMGFPGLAVAKTETHMQCILSTNTWTVYVHSSDSTNSSGEINPNKWKHT